MNKHILISLILFFSGNHLFSQEVITPASTHQELLNAAGDFTEVSARKGGNMLELPFIDDFSYVGIYPADTLWLDRSAFINNRYPINPPSIGVATLDAINDTGGHYAQAGHFPFGADTLTSVPLRLDSLTKQGIRLSPSDSVFFSFYYQPQGLGNAPEKDDSLVLEFYSPSLDTWFHIWATQGMTYDDFYSLYNKSFRWVNIAVTDTHFFEAGFQFRFTNYASLASPSLPSFTSNVDHWHIDYVYLDYQRSALDSAVNDVAFRSGPSSLLNTYHSMPWTHYLADTLQYMNHDIRYEFSKYEGVPEIIDLSLGIFNLTGNNGHYIASPSVFNYGNTPPFTDTILIPRPDFNDYFFRTAQTNKGNVDFLVRAWLKPNFSRNISRTNDTLQFYQRFYNYFAYDDGTAEAGYGLSPAGARLAYRFDIGHPDTIHSVMMYFNATLNNASQQYFHLTVWDESSGYPGNVLHEQAGELPAYGDELNKFHLYELTQPIPVSGNFFVGWRQTTDHNLNVGFDRNNDNKDKIFYNVDGTWYQSLHPGSLMIRPVVGSSSEPFLSVPAKDVEVAEVKIYPNPASENTINIITGLTHEEESGLSLRITDLQGRVLIAENFNNSINIESLAPGIYMIFIIKDGTYYSKPKSFIKL